MKAFVYNQKGEKIGQVLLPKEIFGVKMNPALVHQVLVSQQANQRQGTAHTKDRGEVRGGGRKPWRQKGTGRARHGSIRSPLWKGGGVTFGPRKEKVFKKSIPKKMKRKALLMTLSAKARENLILVLDKLEIKEVKTKKAARILSDLKSQIKDFKTGTVLIGLASKDKNIIFSFRNIPQTKTILAKDLNTLDLLSFKYLILFKDSIKVIKETFSKSKTYDPIIQKATLNS